MATADGVMAALISYELKIKDKSFFRENCEVFMDIRYRTYVGEWCDSNLAYLHEVAKVCEAWEGNYWVVN